MSQPKMTPDKVKRVAAGIEEAINIADIMSEIVSAITDVCSPEDVFDQDDLETWAENNGYVKQE